jgi:GNAT superfamily N-acetyltransferase
VSFVLRGFRAEDAPLVFSTWLRSYQGAPAVRRIPTQFYFEGQAGVIKRLIDRSAVSVACSPEDPDQIFGWICMEEPDNSDPVLHYVHVKHVFRRMGVAKALLAHLLTRPIFYTHHTIGFERLGLRQATYNPYLIERQAL